MRHAAPARGSFEYRFRGFPKPDAGVVIDLASGTIRFDHCFQTYRFLGRVEPSVTCPIDDLLDTHRLRYRGESLTILLKGGKATILGGGAQYAALCNLLDCLIPPGRQGSELSNPWIAFAAVGAAIAGGGVGWFLTPQNGSDLLLAANMAAMAAVAVFATFLAVAVLQRLFGIQLATPLGTGVIGLQAGAPLGILTLTVGNANGLEILSVIGGSFLIGAGIGVAIMIRKELRRDEARRTWAKHKPDDDWDRESLT